MTLTVDEAHPEQVDPGASSIATPPGDAPPETRRDPLRELVARLRAHPETAITFLVVSACCLLVLRVLHPTLLLKDTTPSGGDMGAHVWGPAFLRDHLLPKWRLFGWTPDWYAGFPAFQFYMVIPALMIVALDVVLPYSVAFKLVSVLGLLTLPIAAWALGRLVRAPFPVPALLAVGTLPFMFDATWNIYGGNIASTLAGEYSFSIALSVCLVYFGMLIRALRDGKGHATTAALLALVMLCHLIVFFLALFGTAAIAAVWFRRSARGWLLPRRAAMFATAAALTAFWALPCFVMRGYTFDMGWVKLTSYLDQLFPAHFGWVIGLAAIAIVGGARRHDRLVATIGLMAAIDAFAFRYVNGRLWNARLLPLFYLCLHLLAAIGFWYACTTVVGLVRRSRASMSRGLVVPVAGFAVAAVFVGLPMNTLWFTGHNKAGHPTWFGLSAHLSGLASANWAGKGWVEWNYSGYEEKAAWPEYADTMDTMGQIGKEHGCGRALWEYDEKINDYGTTLAMMLLPYWTKGCIASMEGLYFESSATTPFHFLTASETTLKPSRPILGFQDQWRDLDLNLGIEHMQTLGVRYYMARSAEAITQAQARSELTEVGRAGPWVMFQLSGSDLVVGLDHTPYIEPGIANDGKTWTNAGLATWQLNGGARLFAAPSGPKTWPHIKTGDNVPFNKTPTAVVSNIKMDDTDKLSFDVDRVGSPVLVKISYFPNWTAHGADGPYRVTPNLMVVIPRSKHVTLTYDRTSPEWVGMVLTGLGVVGLVLLARRDRRREPAAQG
ncbi:MAG: hypothetical protein ABJD24_03610 [Acidimicrobiales bacterium]